MWQQAACVCAAADGGSRGHDRNERQAAADAACVRQHAAAAACMRQHAAAATCVRQRAGEAGSTIAMGNSDGSGQSAAQLRWVTILKIRTK